MVVSKRHRRSGSGLVTAEWTASSMEPRVASSRMMLYAIPLCQRLWQSFWRNDGVAVRFQELALLPVTKEPFGRLERRWNRAMAWR